MNTPQDKQLAPNAPIPLDQFKMFLPVLCHSGCDRLPMQVRNLQVTFYLAGYNASRIYLAHTETCMVSEFAYEDLEMPTPKGMKELEEVVFAWMDSAEGIASKELIGHAKVAAGAGVAIPAMLRWPEGGQTRIGVLTIQTGMVGGQQGQWVAAVEAIEDKNVVFRYGLSRIATAMHDGKKLIMRLKPGTIFC